ncbi:hypothetical protein PMAYCL1PPCAC_21239, partial [Pristionchus mayeri]
TYYNGSFDKLVISFGEDLFELVEITQARLCQILRARKSLFRGVSFSKFSVTLRVHSVPLAFALNFTDGFEIRVLWFHINSETELQNSMRVIEIFPRTNYTFILKFQITIDKLIALPPLEEMHIIVRLSLNSDQFLQLISRHKLVHCYYASVTVNWRELKQAMKMISTQTRDRTARLCLDAAVVSNWLKSEGFSESSKVGDACREFELIRLPDQTEDSHQTSLFLRFSRCSIRIDRFDWNGGSFNNLVSMTNADRSLGYTY